MYKVKMVNNEIVLPEKLIEYMQELKLKQIEFEAIEKNLKEQMMKVMVENNIKSFENDMVSIVYKAPYTRTGLDRKRLEKELPSIFEKYRTESNVKESVSIRWK